MIESDSPIFQTLLGTLFTWGMTAAGAGCVVFISGTQRVLLDVSLGFVGGVVMAASYWSLLTPAIEMAEDSRQYGDYAFVVSLYTVCVVSVAQRVLLDASLGFAGGVMMAASYWSLLAPAIEMAEDSKQYGDYAFLPATIGFFIGSLFVYASDVLITAYGLQSAGVMLGATVTTAGSSKHNHETKHTAYGTNGYNKKMDSCESFPSDDERPDDTTTVEGFYEDPYSATRRRAAPYAAPAPPPPCAPPATDPRTQWKRLLLLIVAITVHNIPEGLAVGVGNAAIGSTPSATFQSARNLAIGIGLQNFPEGLAVSLPLKTAGFSTFRSFWYGQLSGMVEPVAGLIGVFAISVAQPLLPYSLAFAAGAMIYVVFDDIIPEAHSSGNGKIATWGAVVGFLVMMCLDVALG